MDKIKLAHEMALAIQGTKLLYDMELVSDMAWKYADAMQAEAEERVSKERPDVLKEEWQPDWSQAPEWANWWAMDADSDCYWFENKPTMRSVTWIPNHPTQINETQPFGFTGNWKDSLRKRPQ